MKKTILTALLFVAVICGVGLTSCDDIDYWDSPPPGYVNYGYDSRLTGIWQLYTADSRPVGQYETNYLQFYGNGRGLYYYYSNGRRETEQITYSCYRSQNSTSNYEIDIDYQYSEPTSMNYWFAGGRLFMQWRLAGSGQPVTYVYQKVDAVW